MARSGDDFEPRGLALGPEGYIADTGVPRYNRRLSDKVLAAFNHAYAVGEIEVAAQLRRVLARLDNEQTHVSGQRRYNGTIALSRADLWIEFVEARNDYRAACEREGADPLAVERSLEAMKSAYQRWSSM